LSESDKTQYVFGTTLYDPSDLTAILLALERDLGVDLETLADSDDRLARALYEGSKTADDDSRPILLPLSPTGGEDRVRGFGDRLFAWEPATLHRAVEIMGFVPGDDPELNEPGGCPGSLRRRMPGQSRSSEELRFAGRSGTRGPRCRRRVLYRRPWRRRRR